MRSRSLDGVEDLDGAHDFEPGERFAPVRRRFRRRPHHDVLEAEPGAGDLAVIGGGVARRRLVMGARLAVPAERLRGAALPVAGARERDRVAGALPDLGEMGERGRRIVEEAQRDPAGGELVLGRDSCPGWRYGRRARDPIGGLGVAEVEQLSRDQPPLDPPLVGVDRLRRIVRQRQDQFGGLGRLVVAAQQLDAAEDQADVAARLRRRHRVEQRLGVRRLLDHRDAGLGDGRCVAAGAVGRAHARRLRPRRRGACPCAPCGRRS